MNLFSKIYFYLLTGVVGMLIIVGNVHYETELAQFDRDMVDNAGQLGRVVAGMVAHTWQESGPDKAIQLIDDANRARQILTLRWVWLDELLAAEGPAAPELAKLGGASPQTEVSYIGLSGQHHKELHTVVMVELPGDRPGAIQLTQSFRQRDRFAQRILLRSVTVTSLLLLVSGVVVYLFIHIKIRKPLEKLSRKALEIGKGNLIPDLEIKGEDELVGLAKTMNDMCTRLLIAKEKIHFEHLARLKTLEQLRHTEKLSTVGQIAAAMAHEIGTPLNVVDGRAKMILAEPLSAEEIVNCARIIKTQAERIAGIIRQLLDYSRKKKSNPQALENVEAVVRQVFHLLAPIAAKEKIELVVNVAPKTRLYSRMDSQQIQQVLMNVIMNSIQATPPGRTVQVDLANTTLRSMLHTDDQLRSFIRIEVSDEGPGIPEEHMSEIFTPFFTTKQIGLGTGLGLSIAQELIEEHGGWIEVANRPVRGAQFTLFLTLEEEP